MEETLQLQNRTPRALFLSSFWLKIIALIAMTLDHSAKMLFTFGVSGDSALSMTLNIFEIIGRIALPIFVFLCAKSLIYTRSRPKYLLRLGIMAVFITIAIFVANALLYTTRGWLDNIFITLGLGVLFIYLIENKRWYIKLLAILPLAYILLFFFPMMGIPEVRQAFKFVNAIPKALQPQYGIYGFLMIIGFYYVQKLFRFLMNRHDKELGNPPDTTILNRQTQFILNIMQAGFFLLFNLLLYLVSRWTTGLFSYGINAGDNQPWAMLATPLFLLYNEKVGYNKKWFKYGTYAYYPLHIGILAIIIYAISALA